MPLLTIPIWLNYVIRIISFYLLAWLVQSLTRRIAARLAQSQRLVPYTFKISPERQATLEGIIASSITLLAFTLATLATIGQFVAVDTLVWMVGLFSAAFGLGARPMISNLLAGIGFIFEDVYGVGEKVELIGRLILETRQLECFKKSCKPSVTSSNNCSAKAP